MDEVISTTHMQPAEDRLSAMIHFSTQLILSFHQCAVLRSPIMRLHYLSLTIIPPDHSIIKKLTFQPGGTVGSRPDGITNALFSITFMLCHFCN